MRAQRIDSFPSADDVVSRPPTSTAVGMQGTIAVGMDLAKDDAGAERWCRTLVPNAGAERWCFRTALNREFTGVKQTRRQSCWRRAIQKIRCSNVKHQTSEDTVRRRNSCGRAKIPVSL